MINNINKKDSINETIDKLNHKEAPSYGYYSKVLQKPFDSLEELRNEETAYYAKLKAKEDAAKAKKADAQAVESAFIALNAARKKYKTTLADITNDYAAKLSKISEDFKNARNVATTELGKAEAAYEEALKAFTSKHPEGFHLTLKDGDYETTISSKVTPGCTVDFLKDFPSLFDFFF